METPCLRKLEFITVDEPSGLGLPGNWPLVVKVVHLKLLSSVCTSNFFSVEMYSWLYFSCQRD